MKSHLYTSPSLYLNPIQVMAISEYILLFFAGLHREAILFAQFSCFKIKLREDNSHLAVLGDVKLPYLILVWFICITDDARFIDVVSGDKIKVYDRHPSDFWAGKALHGLNPRWSCFILDNFD